MSDPNQVIPDDPEAEGLPDVADDTSNAYDSADRPRVEDSPPSLPTRDPVAVDEYGTTPEEQRAGESLTARLAREEPDVSPDDPQTAAAPGLAGEAVSGTADEVAEDADTFGAGAAADLDAPLPGAQVGRLVEPDEGVREDTETLSIAHDSREVEGLSAEEAAIHEIPEDRL